MNGENQNMFTPTIPTLDKTIEFYNSTKQRLNQEKSTQMTNQRMDNISNNLSTSINSTDENIKKQGNLASRTGLVAQMISEEAAKHGKDYSTMTDGEILNTYKSKNPDRASLIDSFINSEQDPYELKKRMGWTNTPAVESKPEESFMDKAKTSVVGPFARALGALGEGAYGAVEGLMNIPNRANEFSQWQVDRGYITQMGPEGENLDTTPYQKLKWFLNLVATPGKMVGDVVGGALMGAASGLSTNKEKEAVGNAVGDVIRGIINSEPGQKVQEMYNNLSEEQKQELGDWLGIADGITESLVRGKTAKKPVQEGLKAVGDAVEGAKYIKKTNAVKNAVKNLEKNTAKAEATAGRIVQGDIDAQKEAVSALKRIDTKDIKTYKDLGGKIDEKAEEIAKKVDTELSKYNDKYSGTTTKVEEIADGVSEAIEYTPAKDAIEDLTQLYEKLGDKKGLAEMGYWQAKLDSEGLTLKELNDLAKKHGNEFRKKAYNKDGTLKFSDVGVKFETNRKNLKEYVRDLLPDDTTKNLDLAYHELMDTNLLVDNMAEKVNTLTQKLKQRGIFEKLGDTAGKVIDTLSGGGIKAFVSKFFPSYAGDTFNNALDMEKELPKLLSKLDDLNRKIDLAETPQEVKEIEKIVEDTFK